MPHFTLFTTRLHVFWKGCWLQNSWWWGGGYVSQWLKLLTLNPLSVLLLSVWFVLGSRVRKPQSACGKLMGLWFPHQLYKNFSLTVIVCDDEGISGSQYAMYSIWAASWTKTVFTKVNTRHFCKTHFQREITSRNIKWFTYFLNPFQIGVTLKERIFLPVGAVCNGRQISLMCVTILLEGTRPSRHMTFRQRRIKANATSWCSIDIDTMLPQRHVPAGLYQ